MKYSLQVLCVIAIQVFFYQPVHAKTYTLSQAVAKALEANPGLEAKQLAVEKSKMDVGVAQSYFWPKVSWVAGQSNLKNSGAVGSIDDVSNTSYTEGIKVSLSLFSGFAHLNNFQKSLLSVDLEKAKHQDAKLALIANMQLEFLGLLRSRDDIKIVQDSKKRIAMQLKAAKAFVEVGMAPYLNILQNEVEMTKVQQQEIRVLNTIKNHEVMLNKYMNYSPNEKITYTGNLKDLSGVVGYTEEQAINTAMFSRPDIIIAQKSIAVAFKQSYATAGRYLPTVSATFDNMKYKKEYDDRAFKDYSRTYWSVGINFSWEFFDGGNTTFSYLSDKKRVESLKKEYEETMSTARAEVIRALLDIQAAKELIRVSRKGMEAAVESYAIANKRYITHTGTITELLDAQFKLTQSEADYSQALLEYHSARAKFFYNIGRENSTLE